MCVVLSVSPATSILKRSHDIRQIALAQHGTSAFMQAVVAVVQAKIDTHTNKLFDVNFFKKSE